MEPKCDVGTFLSLVKKSPYKAKDVCLCVLVCV